MERMFRHVTDCMGKVVVKSNAESHCLFQNPDFFSQDIFLHDCISYHMTYYLLGLFCLFFTWRIVLNDRMYTICDRMRSLPR